MQLHHMESHHMEGLYHTELHHVETESTGILEALGSTQDCREEKPEKLQNRGKDSGHRTKNEPDLIRMEGEESP